MAHKDAPKHAIVIYKVCQNLREEVLNAALTRILTVGRQSGEKGFCHRYMPKAVISCAFASCIYGIGPNNDWMDPHKTRIFEFLSE